jgi:two-component system cell cycle response regulator
MNDNITDRSNRFSIEERKMEIRVLVIEDDAVDLKWVQKQLEAYPPVTFLVTMASRLEQALRCLDTAFYDAVVLDLNLPDSHGGETMLRTLLHSTTIPLVVLTGNRDHHLSDSARQRGVFAYLVKGMDAMDRLARTLHEAVQERRASVALVAEEEEAGK